MSKLLSICTFTFTLLQAPGIFAQTAQAPGEAIMDREIVARLDNAIGKHYPANQPGAVVIVVKNGATFFRKAYGLADIAKGQTMTADMSLRIGSVTKQFTATAILMLADQGKLAVDDDIRKFLPTYPISGKVITIEHLLTHTSGIASYTSMRDFVARSRTDMSVGEMIDYFKDQPKEFEAGQRYSYSNSGYFLLGAIVEKVSGLTYADFLAQNIFAPLGMNDTAYEGRERSSVRHIEGYSRAKKGLVPSPALSMSQPYAAGALVSTVDDLARCDAAISGGKLLKESTWKRAFTPYALTDGTVTKYGYGWEIGKLFGLKIISHSGSISGFNAAVLRIPEDKLYVAVLSNLGVGNDAETAAVQAASIVMSQWRN
ncbi:serine hydrolase domain-containing protein [Duganella aceris]|uniref:Beta-lactamase family protein n=1 Tax=Duganella aceris TaxID=2703883 RepID=A0ABX0FQR2_9BURK|nr:serine hydrolase domain-containing protein [Duganella aceris]NGZ86991.1 beta-lactamase family protein [Duganella aceris]